MIVVNGVPRSEVPAVDRGLAYGDGVFRTFFARDGHGFHWRRQYAKLAHDCEALGLAAPEAAVLERDVETACGTRAQCTVKIIVTRGAGRRGYAYDRGAPTMRVVIAADPPQYRAAQRESGVSVRLCTLRLSHQPALAGVKHLNRLENVLVRAEWSDPEVAEGLLCDTEGNAIGGTMMNLFIVSAGALGTPSLDRCGVAGVTRDRVIEAAARQGLACRISAIPWSEVQRADEIFLVNSLAGAWPVRRLDGHLREPGPVTRALQRALEQEDHAVA